MLFSDFDIDERILKSIRHLGFERVTDVQARAIPEGMAGRDLLVSSKTGSGKTLAYLIPALHRVYRVKALSNQDARVLILVPTRELAKQVSAQLRLLLAGSRLKNALLLGGENFNEQYKSLQKKPHFLVATPGRLVDHLKQRNLFLEGLELLVLDEADRMLDLGFAEQLEYIDAAANHRLRQTLFFSATLDNAHMHKISQLLLREPSRIEVGPSTEEHSDIKQSFYLCDHLEHKEAMLFKLVSQSTVKKAIIFTATRSDTIRLASLLTDKGLNTQSLHGDLSQSARNKVMDAFTRGHFDFLVSTDLAARGLDIAHISHVINFDIPKQVEEYIHRTGRTGRAGFQGEAFSLVGPKDWYNFKELEALFARTLHFDSISGLEATFNGLPPRKKVNVPLRRKPKKIEKKQRLNENKKRRSTKVKYNSTSQEGFDPFILPNKK